MNAKRKVRLRIAGADYLIATEESESYVIALGQELDNRVEELMRENPHVSTTGALVLIALDLCDEAKRSVETSDHLRTQLQEYLADAAKARNEADELKRERDRLQREVQFCAQSFRRRNDEKRKTKPPGNFGSCRIHGIGVRGGAHRGGCGVPGGRAV